jgi:integrase
MSAAIPIRIMRGKKATASRKTIISRSRRGGIHGRACESDNHGLAHGLIAVFEKNLSELVFPGRTPAKPLSNMVFLMAMRRMGLSAVPHGFRSTFRDWASEQTSFPNEVCEMALAHAIRDKTEAAYRRGDLLAKRRDLMEAWSTFCNEQPRWDV